MKYSYNKDYLKHIRDIFYYFCYMIYNDGLYDPLDGLRKLMENSDVCRYIERANPKGLNASGKQLLNSVDLSDCAPTHDCESLEVLHWVSDVYVCFQFLYGKSFAEMVQAMPVHDVANMYYPLHESGLKKSIEKLHARFYE